MGVGWILGNIRRRQTREERHRLRACEIGRWAYGPRICYCFHCARGEGNYLQGLAVQAVTCGGARRRFRAMGIAVSQTSFPYALAREKREPVLWKGEELRHAGLRAAVVER